MLINHTFDEETHTYRAPGWYVLSTSDIISLNGLAEYGQIPKAVLENASERGTAVHKAIEYFETDSEPPEMSEEIDGYFKGWLKFRLEHSFEPIGQMEKTFVYSYGEKDCAIGATIDARGLVDGKPYVLDIKTTSKQYGKALKQKQLAWRMQLTSYSVATEEDEAWWHKANMLSGSKPLGRAIVQLSKDGNFTLHDFTAIEDEMCWISAVCVAQTKLANGFEVNRR
jgi:PD-(D/E)XK nuclease superfamily